MSHTCPHCHPHCIMPEHSSDCIFCPCRKTRPIIAAKVKIELGRKYMLRQGRQCEERRVGSGEIVMVTHRDPVDGTYIAVAHDGEVVTGVQPNELGRPK